MAAAAHRSVQPEPIELTITRVIDAPRALVFRMWSEPEHMSRWCRPKDFAIADGALDFVAGGLWSSQIRGPDGKDYRMGGAYREIVENQRIVFTHRWIDEAGNPGLETTITVTLEDAGERTRLTFHQAVFETSAARDSHNEGWSETLDNLEAHLRALP